MEVWVFVSVIAFLFFVIGAAEPLAAFLRIPFSVVLAVLGILIGGAAIFFYANRTNRCLELHQAQFWICRSDPTCLSTAFYLFCCFKPLLA